MKVEIGESLCYSFLRHVKQCWLVQSNWKVSGHWVRRQSDSELECLFESMREKFDRDGSVFRRTKNVEQFLRQGEIDVVGVGQDGSVHALDVAFHENGLNYGGGPEKRVMKKLLRAVTILRAYQPAEIVGHIYFVSPKVHPGVQGPLEETFAKLRLEYPEMHWHLLTNGDFTSQVVRPTLERAESVADTSELFVRAAKLLDLAGVGNTGDDGRAHVRGTGVTTNARRDAVKGEEAEPGQLQRIVGSLMKTLLEDYPRLLDNADLRNMMDEERCRNLLGLQIGNLPLLCPRENGREISGHYRYWRKVYAGRYYVTNNWWRQHHLHNARSLLRLVTALMERRPGHEGLAALERHRADLEGFAG